MPKIIPNSLDKIGSKTPLKITPQIMELKM